MIVCMPLGDSHALMRNTVWGPIIAERDQIQQPWIDHLQRGTIHGMTVLLRDVGILGVYVVIEPFVKKTC